jgi:poly-gamma-glutamate synthesis protein (capsule biosynthesis protein)
VKGADGIVNLEGPVTSALPKGPGLKLANGPESVQELLSVGGKVAGIANNHARDAGNGSEQASADALRKIGILPVGGPAGPGSFVSRGLKFIIAAYDLTDGVPDGLEGQLKEAKRQGEYFIVSFHVTGPPSYLPRPELRRAVEIALKAGAQIVVAHGSHVVGPVERRGKAIIAWGLGNLVFACDCTNEQEGLLMRVSIGRDAVGVATIIPIRAGLLGEPAELSPDPNGVFDLLEAIGSTKLVRHGFEAEF